MAIRRHTSRSTVSISNRVNSANLALIESRPIPPYAEYLVVAGGGGGGWYGGGGGGGGYLAGNAFLSFERVYTVTVGAGGAIGPSNPGTGGNGSNSLITAAQPNAANVLAYGGGGGGRNGALAGNDGGSGGGGGIGYAGGKGVYPGSTFVSSTRQGYDGGAFLPGGGNYLAAGGGGASEIGGPGFNGSDVPPATAGNGGNGLIWLNGVYYAGGGGGNGYPVGYRKGSGGLGGGATAPAVPISFGENGAINTGGGASGGGYGNPIGGGTIAGGVGGSGVVILRWPTGSSSATANTGSNVVYTNAGGYHTYYFYSSGTITI